MCVYFFIHNNYTKYIHIYNVNKPFILDVINRLTALTYIYMYVCMYVCIYGVHLQKLITLFLTILKNHVFSSLNPVNLNQTVVVVFLTRLKNKQ